MVKTEWWFEYASDWTFAYLVVPQDGNAVVAELRVFPRAPGPAPNQDPHWNRRAQLPPGGLTGRLIRQAEPPSFAVRRFMDAQRAAHGFDGPARPPDEAWKKVWDRATGRELNEAQKRSERVRRRLLVVAYHYSKEIDAGVTKVNEAVASRLGRTASQVRDDVRAARRAGLLEGPPKPGMAGGGLTQEAKAALEEMGIFRRPLPDERKTFQELLDEWAAEGKWVPEPEGVQE